ncbi:hypothetical protein [Photobacterium angustum]|uniref:hypothetical protein n=1 Tax=Photobacterium angustum TaxID=661 RepID=UPI0005DA7A0F|nr:hypothetical protein [Photobacterium angustum]KJG19183.1 hypothetical protein UA33_03980 [Photobacterium angustum]
MRDTILDTLFTVLVCLFLVFTAVEVYENQPDGDLQDNVQDFEIIAHEKNDRDITIYKRLS